MTIHEQIEEIASEFDGEISLAAKNLTSGAVLAHHDQRKCATASVIKLPILVHTLLLAEEGALSLDEPVTVRRSDKVAGSGILTHLSDGFTLTLLDACRLMISLSDNTATNLVLERVTVEGVNARMQALNLTDTWLSGPVFRVNPTPTLAEQRYGLGASSPSDMVTLLEAIHAGSIGGEDVSARISEMLSLQFYRDGIPRLLPEGYRYEGKTGAIDLLRNDVGLVATRDGHVIAMAIFCACMRKPLWTADNPGWLAIARLSRAITDHFTSA